MRNVPQILGTIAIMAPALLLGLWLGQCGNVDNVVEKTVEVVVAPAELKERVEALRLERDGLRARLAGIGEVLPDTVYRDTTVYETIPVPACADVLAMDETGTVSLGRFDVIPGGWQRSAAAGVDLGDCDDGWSWSDEGFTCNRPVFGHFSLGLAAGYAYPIGPADGGVWAGAGLSWRPRYRSSWRVDALLTTDQTLNVTVWRGLWP